MYRIYPSLVLGFHVCPREVAEGLLAEKPIEIKPSRNEYDWLGHGAYFWENSPERVGLFAEDINSRKKGRKINNPVVIGAVLHLGRCLELTNTEGLRVIKTAYHDLELNHTDAQVPMPENAPLTDSADLLLRNLDRAVIEHLHNLLEKQGEPRYDTVRGVFWEGNELYPNAGFREKNHIQVCVRNPQCIKGFFRPMNKPVRDRF